MAKQFTFNDTPSFSNSNQENRPQIDYNALTKHIVEAVGASEKPEAMIGVVSGVISLGLQKQEDAKMLVTGMSEEDQAAELVKNPNQYFESLPDDKGVTQLYKRWAVKDQQAVAVTVDFPGTPVNKGKYYGEGEGEELPYRMLLNGEFYQAGIGKIVGKPYSLREQFNESTKSWGLKNNTILYKLAQAVGALDQQGNFKPAYLGNLIGKAAMFNVHVSTNEAGGKTYLNEKISFNGPVPKMMQAMIPTLDDKHLYMINFKGEQDEEAIKNLRYSVINTMKLASNFVGSDVEKALMAAGKITASTSANDTPENVKAPEQAPVASKSVQQAPAASFDEDEFSDLPF